MASLHHGGSANLFQSVGSRWFLAEKLSAFNSVRTRTINGIYINKENNSIIELERQYIVSDLNLTYSIHLELVLKKMLQRCVYTPSHDALVKCLLKTRVPCPNDSRCRARIEVRSVKNDGYDLLALLTRYRKPCAQNTVTTLLNTTQKPLLEITPCLWEPLHILPPQRGFPVIWLE